MQLWTKEGGAKGWSRAGSGAGARLHAAAGAAPLFMGMHGEGRHTRLHDFDDHLNDLSKCASPYSHDGRCAACMGGSRRFADTVDRAETG